MGRCQYSKSAHCLSILSRYDGCEGQEALFCLWADWVNGTAIAQRDKADLGSPRKTRRNWISNRELGAQLGQVRQHDNAALFLALPALLGQRDFEGSPNIDSSGSPVVIGFFDQASLIRFVRGRSAGKLLQFCRQLLAQLWPAVKRSGCVLQEGDTPLALLLGSHKCLNGVDGRVDVQLSRRHHTHDGAQQGNAGREKL